MGRTNMAEGFIYDWQGLVQEAVLELKPEQLRRKVRKAEAVIFARAQVLSLFGREEQEEQQAIYEALSELEELRKNKSAFPD
jgi:hypothetical protein